MTISRSRVRSATCAAAVLAGLATVGVVVPLTAIAKPKPAVVKARKTNLGTLLVSGSGFTLYVFSSDRRNQDRCVKRKGCTSVWPVDSTAGKPKAGPGVKASMLGTIKLPGGTRQVTYGGHPLYHYSGDFSPGQTDYIGTPQFGGVWHGINPAGKTVK